MSDEPQETTVTIYLSGCEAQRVDLAATASGMDAMAFIHAAITRTATEQIAQYVRSTGKLLTVEHERPAPLTAAPATTAIDATADEPAGEPAASTEPAKSVRHCGRCGEPGHDILICEREPQSKKRTYRCGHCQELGHSRLHCPKRDEGPDQTPASPAPDHPAGADQDSWTDHSAAPSVYQRPSGIGLPRVEPPDHPARFELVLEHGLPVVAGGAVGKLLNGRARVHLEDLGFDLADRVVRGHARVRVCPDRNELISDIDVSETVTLAAHWSGSKRRFVRLRLHAAPGLEDVTVRASGDRQMQLWRQGHRHSWRGGSGKVVASA